MITVLGSINLDLVATTGRLPLPGETVGGKGFATAAGGKGANQALAAHRAGAGMRMIGAVGDDAFAAEALAELTRDKADLSGVARMSGATGVALILVSEDGENVIVVVPGANGKVDARMAREAVAGMSGGDILLLQQEIPADANAAALDAARDKGVTAILNTAPFTEDTADLAAGAAIVVANETEFALLSGEEAVRDIASGVAGRAKSGNQTMIVTLGSEGAIAATPDGTLFRVPAPRIAPVDTVGAGDTFCGYLAAGLDAGLDLEAALRRAAAAGSLACLKPGAQPAIPYVADVEAAAMNPSR